MGIALTINVIMNWFLIPEYTYIGAAISMLASSIILVFLGLPHISKLIKFPVKAILINLGKSAIAAAIMGLFVYSFNDTLHLALLIGLGAILYLILLFLFRGFRFSDIKLLTLSFKK
jgi:O-antigen/teichoic acid export membrane protein